ncbi:MAG TPA: alpha/beta fold hydrolase, partial [Steroidobacteraceae bacterium]|nr:alpha/beta fold hydrolase [Steroidobacteraceae bacterium]
TIDLNVRILQATAPNSKPDPLVVLLGGPGEAATAAAEWYGDDPGFADRDILLVDLRGTGKSNGLHCPLPQDGPLQEFMPMMNLPVLKACRIELEKRADLRFYLTHYAMDDLDDLRAALGYDKINLDGGSYGTRAALAYVRQHGEHVRTVALWGSTAFTQPQPLHFSQDAERALRNVFRDCFAEPACKAAFPDLEADYRRTVERIEKGPVRVTVKDPRNGKPTQVNLEADDFAESLRGMMYRSETMLTIPLVLHKAAAGGDYQAFADYQIGRNATFNADIADGLYFSITCTEDIDRVDPKQLQANARGTFLADHRSRPHMEVCKDWPRGKLPAGFGEEVQSDVPVLIMVGDNDPATPPSAAHAAASRLSNARVVVVPYAGHVLNGLIGERCAFDIAARFLETADPRSLDISCLKDVRHKPFVLR